ncbi:putative multidrug export ATP-binding/permease protein [anaerobic digester metagenome]|jgi:ATP-binding cassette subfamily B protein|nr:MAG: ABC transporter ATP-binding protein [Methanobacteriales archaeon HGW-Methanobacteriales-2]
MIGDLLKLAGKRKTKLIIASILHVISCGLSVVPFFLIYLLIVVLFNPSPDQINAWYLLAAIALIYVLTFAILILAYDLSHRAAYEIIYEVRLELGRKMTRLPLGYYEEIKTGELETIMNENAERLESFLAHHLPEMISTIFVPLFLGIFLFITDWRMALASVLPLLIALTPILIQSKELERMMNDYLTAQAGVNTIIMEYVQGIKAIKAFNQTAESFRKFKKGMATWRDSVRIWSRDRALPFTLYQAFISSAPIFIIPAGLWFYNQGNLTLEIFLLFILVGPIFGSQFMRIYEFLRYGMEEKECMDRINQVLHTKPLQDGGAKKILEKHDITFRNVKFSYDRENEVLHDVDFQIPGGSKFALVGPSGSGKTTIARLIPRFWDVDGGEILIDQLNIQDMPFTDLLSMVSMVFQDNFLFNDTVMENIRIARPEATLEDVMKVSRAARCHEFIEKLPEGYHTMVGERGTRLSGGEKQRITIARALLKDAPIVILDEATVFIDPENESFIQEAIDNLTRDKTVLIIAHKLSTITTVDQIIVLEGGKIVEKGKHDELVRKEGLYRHMWKMHVSTMDWRIREGEENV